MKNKRGNKDMENAQRVVFACDEEACLFDKHNGGYSVLQKNADGEYELMLAAGDGELIKVIKVGK